MLVVARLSSSNKCQNFPENAWKWGWFCLKVPTWSAWFFLKMTPILLDESAWFCLMSQKCRTKWGFERWSGFRKRGRRNGVASDVFRFFPFSFRFLPFFSVFFRFFLFSSVFSVFFLFFRFIFRKKRETPFVRPLLRNPEMGVYRHRVNGVGRGGGQTPDFNQILTRFHGIQLKSG